MAGIASEINTPERQVQSACAPNAAVRMQRRNESDLSRLVHVNMFGMINKKIKTCYLSNDPVVESLVELRATATPLRPAN